MSRIYFSGPGWDNPAEKRTDDAELEREWDEDRLSPWDERFREDVDDA